MMLRWLYLLLFPLMIAATFSTSNPLPPVKKPAPAGTYDGLWKQVDQLEGDGKPASAREIVHKILEKSTKENNGPQQVKAALFIMRYNVQIEEEAGLLNIYFLDAQRKASKNESVKSLLASIEAESFWSYRNEHQYEVTGRTITQGIADSIAQWDERDFEDSVKSLYLASIAEKDHLYNIPVREYSAVLDTARNSSLYRPTLYDLLAYRALDFFTNSQSMLSRASEKNTTDSLQLLQDNKAFIKLNLNSQPFSASNSNTEALHIYQQLLKLHLDDKNPAAFINADLLRLEFAKNITANPGTDSVYYRSLLSLEQQNENNEAGAQVAYQRAVFVYNTYRSWDIPEKQSNASFAHDICDQWVKKFPASPGGINCGVLRALIEKKRFSQTIEEHPLPGMAIKVHVEWKNISKLWYRVIPFTASDAKKLDELYGYNYYKYLAKMKFTASGTWQLFDDGQFRSHSTDMALNSLKPGMYIIISCADGDFEAKRENIAYSRIQVTGLHLITENVKFSDKIKGYVVDAVSGRPIKGANVEFNYSDGYFYDKYTKSLIRTTDALGSFELDKAAMWGLMTITNGNDRLDIDLSVGKPDANFDFTSQHTRIFTDRNIYRPGQTVFFKAIQLNQVTKNNTSDYSLVTGKELEFQLNDVNGSKVTSLITTTNEFGSCAGSFVLPTGMLNGSYNINTPDGGIDFRVEEYKRPGFEVLLDTPKVALMLNEVMQISGRAASYSGVNLANCTVSYRIVRNARYITWRWWLPLPDENEVQIADGNVTTDNSGNFTLSFKALPGKSVKGVQTVFNYTVFADVTDITGETQSSSIIITVGDVAITANIDIPETMDKTIPGNYQISVSNLNQIPMSVKGKIVLQELVQPKQLFRERILEESDTQLLDKKMYVSLFPNDAYRDENEVYNYPVKKTWMEQQVVSNTPIPLTTAQLKNLPPGYYKISFETKDTFGQLVKAVKFLKIYDPESKKAQLNKYFYVLNSKTENLKPGEEASFIIGSATNLRIRLVATHNGNIVREDWLDLDNSQLKVTIPISEEERGGIYVHMFAYTDNRSLKENLFLSVPEKNKTLDIIPGVLHSTLKPGQKEQWQMRIKGPDGGAPHSELMVTMYDASLDAFVPHEWYFDINKYYIDGYEVDLNNITKNGNTADWGVSAQYYYQGYDRLNTFGALSYYSRYGLHSFGNRSSGNVYYVDGIKMKSAPAYETVQVQMDPNDPYSTADSMVLVSDETTFKKPSGNQKDQNATRKNLTELAYFYPQLQTDNEGNVSFDFTVPDALTRWKVMAFAHDKDLDYGQYSTTVVTQKELMVQPYIPRFFREGDSVIISAKISNLSGNALQVSWNGEFYDVNAQSASKKVKTPHISEAKGKISLDKGESKEVSFTIAVPLGPEGITYKITAETGKFFDGQEGVIPVLPNRKLVTESLTLPINGKGTQKFDFNSLLNYKSSSTLAPYKVKVEMTSNPAWYAVQALPYLVEYPYECAEQTFDRFYANAISQYIVKNNPKIQKVYEQWKKEGSEALISNLEKNQDVKNILLQETPWVMEAKTESEQKQRIAYLFDPNIVNINLRSAIIKLKQMQGAGGGWPWFEGMSTNWYITQYITEGIAHLKSLGVETEYDNDLDQMAGKGLDYIDDRMKDAYKDLLKYKADLKANNLNPTIIHYLYTRSFFANEPLASGNKTAYNYWLDQAKTYGIKASLYEKALLASAWFRLKEKALAEKYIASLKEFALHSPEMGMYWKNNSRGWYWYQDMTQTQCMLIEAFHLAGAGKEVEEMKIWLLKQKQTQNWPTTISTAQAVYALLSTGKSWIEDNELVQVWIGNNKVKPGEGSKPEPGTGYYSQTYNSAEIAPGMGHIKVEKKDSGIAWGAVYFQYYEQLDKISTTGKELQITKTVYVKKTTKNGFELEEVMPFTKLHTGDLLTIKLEIRTDRTLDYVHISDQRAGALEPLDVLSEYEYKGGLGYYQSVKDASMNWFVDRMGKGNYSLEYDMRVNQAGRFSNGIAEIQCMYAPEFSAHSNGIVIEIAK
jgi:uncharacterized protein YfaS (alpha-2-macroglobulin family)